MRLTFRDERPKRVDSMAAGLERPKSFKPGSVPQARPACWARQRLLIYSYFLLFYSKQMKNTPQAQDAQRRIARLSRWVRLICALLGLLMLGMPALFWAQPGWVESVARSEWGLSALQLDGLARLGGLAASLLSSAVALWALWQVWQLFGCLSRGELFSQRTAQYLQKSGAALLLLVLALPLSRTLAVLALTLGNPAGKRMLVLNLDFNQLACLLAGLVLLALARVMHEAARVADENASFV